MNMGASCRFFHHCRATQRTEGDQHAPCKHPHWLAHGWCRAEKANKSAAWSRETLRRLKLRMAKPVMGGLGRQHWPPRRTNVDLELLRQHR